MGHLPVYACNLRDAEGSYQALHDFASSINFGECEAMAQPVARGWLLSPLIHQDFRDCYLRVAGVNLASATLNHQKRHADLLYTPPDEKW
jgi:hypothetical protein